jgi:hypothetical protein
MDQHKIIHSESLNTKKGLYTVEAIEDFGELMLKITKTIPCEQQTMLLPFDQQTNDSYLFAQNINKAIQKLEQRRNQSMVKRKCN